MGNVEPAEGEDDGDGDGGDTEPTDIADTELAAFADLDGSAEPRLTLLPRQPTKSANPTIQDRPAARITPPAYQTRGRLQAHRQPVNGKATVIIPKSPTGSPVLVDDKNNYQTVGAIRVHKDAGRDALDVRLRLRTPLVQPGTNAPFELESLTCLVQLKVPDVRVDDIGQSDGILVVPTAADGPRAVNATTVFERRVVPQRFLSVKF